MANKVEDVDLNVFEAGRGTSKQTVDILAKGSSLLGGKGMDSFRKRWKSWAEGGAEFDNGRMILQCFTGALIQMKIQMTNDKFVILF